MKRKGAHYTSTSLADCGYNNRKERGSYFLELSGKEEKEEGGNDKQSRAEHKKKGSNDLSNTHACIYTRLLLLYPTCSHRERKKQLTIGEAAIKVFHFQCG